MFVILVGNIHTPEKPLLLRKKLFSCYVPKYLGLPVLIKYFCQIYFFLCYRNFVSLLHLQYMKIHIEAFPQSSFVTFVNPVTVLGAEPGFTWHRIKPERVVESNLHNIPGFVSKVQNKPGDRYNVLGTRWLLNRDTYNVLLGMVVLNRYSLVKQTSVWKQTEKKNLQSTTFTLFCFFKRTRHI